MQQRFLDSPQKEQDPGEEEAVDFIIAQLDVLHERQDKVQLIIIPFGTVPHLYRVVARDASASTQLKAAAV